MNDLIKEILTEYQRVDYTEVAGALEKLPITVKERIYFMIKGVELIEEQSEAEAAAAQKATDCKGA